MNSEIPVWNKPPRPVTVEELRGLSALAGNDVNVLITWTSETQSYQLVSAGRDRAFADAAARFRDLIAERLGLHLNGLTEDRRDQHPDQRPTIICLCGSSRFVEEIAIQAWEFEKKGYIVLSLHLLPKSYAGVRPHHQAEAEDVAAILDHVHMEKIRLADRIFVMNVGGYIGERTSVEIEYAQSLGKPIKYLFPLSHEPCPTN